MDAIFVQLIGAIGLIFVVLSFQKDNRSFTLICHLFASIFFGIHFFLLGFYTVTFINAITALRAFFFYFKGEKKWFDSTYVMYSFLLLFWLAPVFTWQGLISLLVPISMTFETLGLWSKRTKIMRRYFFAARPTWLLNDFLAGSIPGMLTEAFLLISLTIATIRFDILKKKE